MRFNWSIVSFSVLFLLPSLTAVMAEEKSVKLNIKPRVCNVAKAGDLCEMTINIAWQSLLPISTCLYQNKLLNSPQRGLANKSKTLCWQNTKTAKGKLAIKLTENTLFTLENTLEKNLSEADLILAEQLITVNSATPKNYRRRLRADWSLF